MELVTGHKGENHVTSAQDARRNLGIFGGNVRHGMESEKVSGGITIGAGWCIIDGRFIVNDAPVTFSRNEVHIVLSLGGSSEAASFAATGGTLFASYVDGIMYQHIPELVSPPDFSEVTKEWVNPYSWLIYTREYAGIETAVFDSESIPNYSDDGQYLPYPYMGTRLAAVPALRYREDNGVQIIEQAAARFLMSSVYGVVEDSSHVSNARYVCNSVF